MAKCGSGFLGSELTRCTRLTDSKRVFMRAQGKPSTRADAVGTAGDDITA